MRTGRAISQKPNPSPPGTLHEHPTDKATEVTARHSVKPPAPPLLRAITAAGAGLFMPSCLHGSGADLFLFFSLGLIPCLGEGCCFADEDQETESMIS